MVTKHATFPYVEGPRHSERIYDQSGEPVVLRTGDRFLVPCRGGPCTSRLEIYPPRLEIDEYEGMYVLVDDGPRDDWYYRFIDH